MQTIIRTNKTANFTILDNSIINANLSALARMTLIYLLSKPLTWKLRPTDIKRHLDIGINKVYRLLKELREAGYIVMKRIQAAVHWFVYDTPQGKAETATTSASSNRDESHHDENGDVLIRTETPVRTEKPQQHAPEPIQATEKPDVVVSCDEVANDRPISTSTKAIDDIPHIEPHHQAAAKRALSRLTSEQVQMVLAVFALQCSKTAISNKPGYLIRLVQSAIDGTFSPVQAQQSAPAMTAAERIAQEKLRQEEAQARGMMSNETYFAWLAREYGGNQTVASISEKLKKLQTKATKMS